MLQLKIYTYEVEPKILNIVCLSLYLHQYAMHMHNTFVNTFVRESFFCLFVNHGNIIEFGSGLAGILLNKIN